MRRIPWVVALTVLLGTPLWARDVIPRIDLLQIEMIKRVSPAVVALTCEVPINQLTYYGTGAVVSADGLILTNLSVIPPQGQQIKVFFRNGQVHKATIVEYDVKTESTLIQITTKGTYPFLRLADSSKARVGQAVFTFGNPYHILELDAQVAVAAGAISAIGRVTDNAEEQDQSNYHGPVIETDAAVNPGADGGPIVDSAGQLIGVMSLAFQRERLLGTAIPVHLISRRIQRLKRFKLGPLPRTVLSPATHVLARGAAKLARGVVWLKIDRAPERPLKMPDEKAWEKLNVFEKSAWMLRKLMQRPPGYATGISIDGGKYVLTSAYHFTHNRERDPTAQRPLIRSVKIHAQGMARPLTGRIISRYEPYDLALIEVVGGRLPASLEFGSSKALREGSYIGVLGRQRGSTQVTMTQGIVSTRARKYNFIKAFQTGALVNYANLGGPVIDLEGRMVGMASFLRPSAGFGINSGVALFTGSDTIRGLLAAMKSGRNQKNPPLPFLGIRAWQGRSFGGAAVAGVNLGSGAHRAGVRPGDLIISVDGSPIGEWSDLIRTITAKRIGQKIVFEVKRGKRTLKLSAVLARRQW